MKQELINFQQQFEKGLKAAEHIKVKGKFNKVIVCGMGGSAWPTNMLIDYLGKTDIPLYIHRTYGCPDNADKKTLIIASSSSGNTEETISACEECNKKGFKVVIITNGGKLEQLAKELNLPIALIPKINPPESTRFGSGYVFSALVKILSNSGIIKDRTKELLDMNLIDFEEQGKQLAKRIKDKIPLIYSPYHFKSLGRNWKINFNESPKIMSFWNYFPEMNHNEINGLERPLGNFYMIILRDTNDHKRILKRIDIFKQMAQEKGITAEIIDLQGKNNLEKIFNSYMFSNWTCYYLSQEYNINPDLAVIVEDLKSRLG